VKKAIFIVLLLAVLASVGCGSSDAPTVSGNAEAETVREESGYIRVGEAPRRRFATITGGKGGAKPRIEPADLPAPKESIARDLEVGDGPVAHPGDTAGVYYLGVDYETAKLLFYRWPPTKPLVVNLVGSSSDPWEAGIEGMKVGGRREIVVPWSPADVNDYVVELVWVKNPGGAEAETEPAGN
jgi:peptidylprolyl isomerase